VAIILSPQSCKQSLQYVIRGPMCIIVFYCKYLFYRNSIRYTVTELIMSRTLQQTTAMK